MPAWRSAETNFPWRHLGLAFLGLLLGTQCTASESFNIRSASTQLVKGVYRLHAQIDYPLNKEVKTAIESGIPLIVNQEIEVLRLRWWLWPKTIKHIILRYQLKYHALSEQFVLTYLNQDTQRTYPNLTAAIKQLSTIKHYPLITRGELDLHHNYRIRLKTSLSIKDLPAPMRPLAYLSPQWYLDSPWFSWLLESPNI
ncbi:DUF4390 domain-containing protein [Nitrosococcus oceani]|uniref:Proline rich signal peptide protein n=2 Tax=Nitrosococcus oceani TaxID=1229 RepID=Q3J6T7_NITOC|nr:DUF4390 domain-containing protein [Nitrosococcus oceani]KFI18201.1 hypothetical protein IB75_16035 [Nitrosococcus oceani C-27]ABA59459.1 conserved hypothetical protein [Nitrosococcus oceani ATCC 19707]EDZ65452.1 hypothetical protein NOC27_2132 [Nitrosococcus oceani AFC27]KFI21264.1 hypothetical protein HW44_15700 [Nitrosococcus oceani]GEM19971.1 hypothetical protein NONS58_13750 [Nitrosococcus oceani]